MGGLIGLANTNQNGLIDKQSYSRIYQILGGRGAVYKLIDAINLSDWTPANFTFIAHSTDILAHKQFLITYTKAGDSLRVSCLKRMKDIGSSTINFYAKDNILYVEIKGEVRGYIFNLPYSIISVSSEEVQGLIPLEVVDAF